MNQHEVGMASCPKCNAELGEGAKFCTGCGMPVLLGGSSDVYVPPPVSQVNPFATTASPNQPISAPTDAELAKALSDAAPKAAADTPVSPLAFSNAVSERGAFQQVAAGVKELRSEPPAPPAAKKPGTQVMPNAPTAPPPKVVQRTVAMNASGLVPPSAPRSAGSTPPSSPSSSGQYNAANVPQPTSRYGHNPGPAPSARPNAPYPGARVLVAWSNGQRYPATVSQVNGSQCHVVFPDGQQHWVDMMYLSPA